MEIYNEEKRNNKTDPERKIEKNWEKKLKFPWVKYDKFRCEI